MAAQENIMKGGSPSPIEHGCKRVVELYNTGTNCDRAVLQVLKEIWRFPEDRWDFNEYYSDKPDDAKTFLCKVVAAGAVGIYLDVLKKNGDPASMSKNESTKRVMYLVNTFLIEASGKNHIHPTEFDPFKHDKYLEEIQIAGAIRKEYADRAKIFLTAFEKRFKVLTCQEILGFDPFLYEEYDEEMQEFIEEGEWMAKCCDCMKFIIAKACGD